MFPVTDVSQKMRSRYEMRANPVATPNRSPCTTSVKRKKQETSETGKLLLATISISTCCVVSHFVSKKNQGNIVDDKQLMYLGKILPLFIILRKCRRGDGYSRLSKREHFQVIIPYLKR